MFPKKGVKLGILCFRELKVCNTDANFWRKGQVLGSMKSTSGGNTAPRINECAGHWGIK